MPFMVRFRFRVPRFVTHLCPKTVQFYNNPCSLPNYNSVSVKPKIHSFRWKNSRQPLGLELWHLVTACAGISLRGLNVLPGTNGHVPSARIPMSRFTSRRLSLLGRLDRAMSILRRSPTSPLPHAKRSLPLEEVRVQNCQGKPNSKPLLFMGWDASQSFRKSFSKPPERFF